MISQPTIIDEEKVKALHPANTLSNKVRELFKRDPALRMTWNETGKIVTFYCTDLQKTNAIRYVLPEVYDLAENTKLYIEVYYKINDTDKVLVGRPKGYHYNPSVFCQAFEGNPLWYYVHEWREKALSNDHCWAGFSPETIFYVDDDLQNLYGDSAFLAAELAEEVLDTDGIHICTYNPNRKLIKRNTAANSLYENSIDWDYDS